MKIRIVTSVYMPQEQELGYLLCPVKYVQSFKEGLQKLGLDAEIFYEVAGTEFVPSPDVEE